MNNPEARKRRNKDLKEQVIKLYKEGYSYREMSKMLEISHEWARQLHVSSTIGDNSLTGFDSKE
jgi:transposase-like protein